MYKKILFIPFFIIVICLFSLFALGCGKKEDSPKKSDHIAKKVIPKAKKIPDSTASSKEKEETDKKALPEQKDKEKDVVEEAGKSEAQAGVPDQYIPTGKIDPFAPLYDNEQVVAAAKPMKKRKREHLTPLEKLDLSQLNLLGVILAPSGNRALVSEANGKGYVVTVGTYMGIASGRVVEILTDRIVVEEEVENILGKVSLRKRELKLQKPAGE